MQEIEAGVRAAHSLSESDRTRLLQLVGALRQELDSLGQDHREDAQSIAHFLSVSMHEVSRKEKRPRQLEAAGHGLTASVETFESSHPRLFEVVNQAAVILTNMGL